MCIRDRAYAPLRAVRYESGVSQYLGHSTALAVDRPLWYQTRTHQYQSAAVPAVPHPTKQYQTTNQYRWAVVPYSTPVPGMSPVLDSSTGHGIAGAYNPNSNTRKRIPGTNCTEFLFSCI
eukprot:249837-Rhodomonas_salina.1